MLMTSGWLRLMLEKVLWEGENNRGVSSSFIIIIIIIFFFFFILQCLTSDYS